MMSEPIKQSPIDLRAYHPLARLRWIIRAYVLVEGLALAAILACVWFWLATALDFGLHHFAGIDLLDRAPWVRRALLVVFSLAMLVIVVWFIFTRLFRDFRPAALALVLEKRFPQLLGDRLITAIELVDLKKAREQGYSVEMIVKTMKDAKERVDQVPVHTVFNWPRLLLLAWSLVGVSAFILLLIYPVAMLLSLFGQPRGPALWAMLTINALLALSIVFVFLVPCMLAWIGKAGAKLRWAALAVGLLCAAGAAVGYDYALNRINNMRMHEYSWRLYHATGISVDRNFLFKNTRWPHDVYFVDWLDFPVAEKRIQINRTINARAFFTTWTIADAQAPEGWRPMKWSDLPRVLKPEQIPALPDDRIHGYLIGLTGGDDRSPVGYDMSELKLPADLPVDLALAVIADENVPGISREERASFARLSAALADRAADPRLGGRLIRQVSPPESLTLTYGNDQSRQKGKSKLSALEGRRNVYALEQPVQLNDAFVLPTPEDISFGSTAPEKKVPFQASADVDGRTVRTPEKKIVLVRPASVQTLVCQEASPGLFLLSAADQSACREHRRARRLMRDLRPDPQAGHLSAAARIVRVPSQPDARQRIDPVRRHRQAAPRGQIDAAHRRFPRQRQGRYADRTAGDRQGRQELHGAVRRRGPAAARLGRRRLAPLFAGRELGRRSAKPRLSAGRPADDVRRVDDRRRQHALDPDDHHQANRGQAAERRPLRRRHPPGADE